MLVTGGAGTIGSTIVDQLLDARVGQVRILDNLTRGRRENLAAALGDPRTELVIGDLRDVDLVHDVTKGCDVVFHQAAIPITQCAEEPRLALALFEGSPLFSPPNDQTAHRTWRSRYRTAKGRTTMRVNLMPAVNNNGASAATERIPIAGSWVTDLEVRYVAEAAASI